MKKYIALGLLAVLLFALCGCGKESEATVELLDSITVVYDTAAVKRGDVQRMTQASAFVYASEYELTFDETGGILAELCVMPGDTVSTGDILARLDTTAINRQIQSAQQSLDSLNSALKYELGQIQYDIELVKNEIARAETESRDTDDLQLNLEKLQLQYRQKKQSSSYDIELAEEKLDSLNASLNNTVITATHNGEISYAFTAGVGSYVRAGQTILRLIDYSGLYVEAVSSDNLNYERIAALIDGVEYPLDPVLYDQEEYLSLVLSGQKPNPSFTFAGEAESIRAGQFAALRLYIRESLDTLYIPINCLYTSGSEWYVYLLENGEKTLRPVKVGVTNPSIAEITDGLEEGDIVYVKQ